MVGETQETRSEAGLRKRVRSDSEKRVKSAFLYALIPSHRKPFLRMRTAALSAVASRHLGGSEEIGVRRQFRTAARFVRVHEHSRKLDRNEAIRIRVAAWSLEKATKPAGSCDGVLGRAGLRVLEALLFRFRRRSDGLCCPGYSALRAETGYCYATISKALKRLAAAGVLRIVRRLVRELVSGKVVARQGSNLYAMYEPSPGAEGLPVGAPVERKFRTSAFAELRRVLGLDGSGRGRVGFWKERRSLSVGSRGQGIASGGVA